MARTRFQEQSIASIRVSGPVEATLTRAPLRCVDCPDTWFLPLLAKMCFCKCCGSFSSRRMPHLPKCPAPARGPVASNDSAIFGRAEFPRLCLLFRPWRGEFEVKSPVLTTAASQNLEWGGESPLKSCSAKTRAHACAQASALLNPLEYNNKSVQT